MCINVGVRTEATVRIPRVVVATMLISLAVMFMTTLTAWCITLPPSSKTWTMTSAFKVPAFANNSHVHVVTNATYDTSNWEEEVRGASDEHGVGVVAKKDIEDRDAGVVIRSQVKSVSMSRNSHREGGFLKLDHHPTTLSRMNSLLAQSLASSSHSMKPRWSSVPDRELLFAKVKIEHAPLLKNIPTLHTPAFRNVSVFKRSYELMENMLKVYIYKEGEKPVFHQTKLRGVYASEGWFMKLMESNKKFVVKNPRRAHLFYLPFSSVMLRNELIKQTNGSRRDHEQYLKNYLGLVMTRYSFWNRTGGTDHFFVGCHDWAPRVTRPHMSNCIRVLCDANLRHGFLIGKDVSLPTTYIRSSETPQDSIGGKPSMERSILAFFAGGMHGYLRPILLQHWENKESDMKIFGQMSRDFKGKSAYREYMKTSKYCICARGYEVHTPRVVEAILYECVPVIISDNYVPPFFEVLNWEAFAVFIQESDIANLRNILLSIPEEKYIEMQSGVRKVQHHFLWHKKPVRYDLFHMILHSVWYNRVFQTKNR